MVQTGMAAPYGGGVFPPPVNGVAGVVGAAGAAGDVKPPPPVPVKEDNAGAPQQPPPTGGPQVPPAAGAPHPSAPGAPTAASFSPPPPPNGVDQQAIVSNPDFLINATVSDRLIDAGRKLSHSIVNDEKERNFPCFLFHFK